MASSALRRSAGALLASTLAIGVQSAIAPVPAMAQHTADTINFSIPPGPLGAALIAWSRQAGVQVSYLEEAMRGKSTAGFSATLSPTGALARLLAGSELEYSFHDARTVVISRPYSTSSAGEVQLDQIRVTAERPSTLLSGDGYDTGTTELEAASIAVRSDGSGDANSVLTTLPNVQYRNDTDTDAGQNIDDVLDLQPLEVSISGARVDENNIMIDGTSISSIGASDNPYASTGLSRVTGSPNLYAIYGTHSQTQYVPSSMVESIRVQDSNISAEHGGFQGGVVNYRLARPDPKKAHGSAEFSYQDERFVHYKLGTEDGDNPEEVKKPEWTKRQFSFTHNQPIDERTAIIFGYSRATAEGKKSKDAQYTSGYVNSESKNEFYRLGVSRETDIGTFSLTGNYTDYHQKWDGSYSRDMGIDVVNRGRLIQGSYDLEFDSFSLGFAQANNVKLSADLTLQNNDSGNDYNSNVAYNWIQRVYATGWESTLMDDWCQSVISGTSNTTCRSGGYGDRYQSDDRIEAKFRFSGDIWNGKFSSGLSVSQSKVQRKNEGFTLYTSTATSTLSGKSFSAFTCADGDPSCNSEQYASTRSHLDPYNISVKAAAMNTWLELDQKWGDFSMRGGLRLDYNDVIKNWDVAPRLVTQWKPVDTVALSLGFNRYYSANYLGYKIHDTYPRPSPSTRTANSSGVVGDWTERSLSSYYFTGNNLDTPYTDEISVAATIEDNWTDGIWRLHYIHRDGKNQFARSEDSTSAENTLTNDGWTKYDSVTLEYDKQWKSLGGQRLDHVGLYISGTWSQRQISNASYFGSDGTAGLGEYYWYNDKSYSLSDFSVVTGNMDIPVRATVELRGSWDDGRYEAGIGADVAFRYTGVVDTGDTVVANNSDGYSGEHYVYKDYRFSTAIALNLMAKIRLTEINGNPLNLDMKVANLLDDTGNRTATSTNPWMPGRSIWIGTSYTW